MFNPGTFAMDDGGRCLLDVINDPLLLQSFLEDKNEEVSKELSSLESVLLGRDEVSSTTSCLPARCELPDSMGYGCSGTDKPVAAALAVSATSAAAPSDVSAASPQLLVSSTVPPAPPPAAASAAASNGLPGASPHSTRSSPANSRPHSASPLPAPTPVSWSSPGPIAVSRSQSLSSSASTPATTKATATVAPLPVAPQQAPPSRPNAGQVVSGSPSPRTAGAPRLIQPKQPQILPKLSSGSANMTTPAATATTRSQSPRAAQHKATPQPAPVPAPQPATTVQRGAAMGLNTGSPLLIGNPGAAQAGMFQAGPAQGTFLLNQYIPGLGQSPILIQGSLGQIQGSLGQIQGVQLSLRPPHATGLSLGPQAGHKPHGGHPGQPGTPTLVIPQNLGPRPNFILAPRMVSSPLQFAIAPGQPLTLQQLQAMLPAQTMLAQPTLGTFQTDQHQGLVQIPTFNQAQILAHDHHHHHHHHHHGALSAPLISTGGTMVSSAHGANLVTHHPVMTTTTVLHPAPPQPAPVPVSAPMTSATIQQQPQARTTASPAAEKVKAPSVNLAELLKEHGIMPESTPPPSPTSNQDSTISVDVPVTPAPVTENVQVVVSKSPQTVAVSPQQRVQLSLAHDGSVVLHPHGSNLSSMPAPVQSPGLVATTVTPTSTSAPGATALSRTHSALLERLSAAPPVSVPDLASLTAPRVSVSAPTMVAAPSLVAPSVMTPSMMAATTHPHQLTLHTVNNGLVPAQQLGQPQSFVTLHGTAVANMLCHGNNARINHIVVSPSPSLGHQQQQQQQHHHHQHALHHTCHAVGNTAVVSSVASAVVPTTTTTAVMVSSPSMVGRTAVPTSMPHPVVTVAACPTVTTVTVTPTVVVTTSNSNATAHASGKCTAPMNSQNQQLYEQLQSQITYLNSLKKPTMQQKLLLQQMLSIEEKLRDSTKPQVSSSSNDTSAAAAVPTSHAHCMQRHEVKPTVVSHPMPAAATIITVKPSAVTTVQVPTITVATTTRTNSRTTHHKVNHADVKPKASILHVGNTASIIATQKAITSHSGPVRIIATAPTTTSAACASSTCSSAPCSSASALSVPLASASPLLSSPSVAPVSSASLVSSVPLVSAAPLASTGPLLSTASLTSSSITPVSSALPSLPVASNAPLVSSMPTVSTSPALAPTMPVVSCAPSAPAAPLVSNMPVVSCIPPSPAAPLSSMPVVSCIPSAPSQSPVSNTLVVSCAPSSHTAPLVSNMPVVSSCIPSTPMVSKMPLVSCAPSAPTAALVSSKPMVSCLPPVSTSALVSSLPQGSAAISVSSAPHISGTLLVSTAALMSSPSLLASSTPLMSSAPLVSTAQLVSSAPLMSTASLMSTTPMTSTAPMVSYASLVSSAPVVSTAPIMAPSTTDMTVPSMASHPVATVASHLRVPNQASSKFVPQLHHAVHHHHHHHHHLQPSPVASSVSPVNQRSPPQPRPQPVVVRLQHPTNHIIAPPSTTKQILVQVPSVVNKPPSSKSSGSSNSSSSKSTVPVLPSKVEPIVPKPPLPPPEQPPAPPPPPSKPVVVKPKVPDRVQKMHMFHQRLLEDQNGAMAPDTKNPFTSRRDACQRLLRYHVYNSGLPREEDLHKTDELFAEVSERLLGESRQLYQKFHYLMLKEGMRECSSAEKIMIEKLFLEHETDALIAEKRAAEEGQYTPTVEPPALPPMPVSAWTFESSPSLPLPRPVKKEPPDSWLDDDDRSDLEPAPKRRSIKEEEHETVMAPMEEEPPSLPRVSVTPEHVDLVLSIHKELNMSPSETGEDDEFAHGLADFEPPVARFPSTADLKQPQFSSSGNVVPPVVVPDWTCSGKSADSEPRAPELDLSGIEGLDDDSSGVDPLGRTHYFGEDEEEDKDSVELHDQVQSAINSILDFRRAGADDGLCVDSKGAVTRSGSGPEPMDYDDATGDTQPTDSVLDEAVRSILL